MDVEDDAQLAELSRCANKVLGEKYQCYCLRSPAYLRQIGGELSAGDGRMLSVWERQNGGERLIGMECFDYADTTERDARLVLPEKASIKFCGTEPFIMARVLSLPDFFAGIALRPEVAAEERELFFSLKDSLIAENNGVFCLRATKCGSRLERLAASGKRGREITALTPEELVSVFFGMKHALWAEELTSYRAYFDEEM